jgi:hypothetical protein
MINVSSRANVGPGDDALVVGFVVSGTVPKRLLIRGIGPSLGQFGVAGALGRPQLSVYAGQMRLAQNAGWSASPDAPSIIAGARQVGTFPLATGSADAALVIHLDPGIYTLQITGIGGSTGVALAEVYELP